MNMKWEKFISSGIRMPFYMQLFIEGIKLDKARLTGIKLNRWVSVSDKQLTSVYYDPDDDLLVQKFFKKRIANPSFLARLLGTCLRVDQNLLSFCRQLYFRDYQKTSDQTLEKLLNKFVILFRMKFGGVYALPKLITGAVVNLLPQFIKTPINKDDLSHLIEANTFSDFTKERMALLSITKAVVDGNLKMLFTKSNQEIIEQLGRFHPALYYQIERYVRDFAWVPVNHHVQPLNLDLALAAIKETLRDDSALAELRDFVGKPAAVVKKQKELVKKYKLSSWELKIIEFLRNINSFNESRKAAMSKALLWSYPLFQTIADRVGTDVVSLRQLNAKEMAVVLKSKKVNGKYQKIMKERLDFYFCLLDGGQIIQKSGEAGRQFAQKTFSFMGGESASELKGMVAQKGKVTGRVRLILMEYQVENLEPGEILVASMTDPDMVPAMKKAAAIVTDEGGITCHAAIVSRELGTPCLIGTKIATKVFKDGDLVEVDADRGIVRKVGA